MLVEVSMATGGELKGESQMIGIAIESSPL